MRYAKALSFEEQPDYEYLNQLFDLAAGEIGADLDDGVFDWSVKATILKKYPLFYSKILSN